MIEMMTTTRKSPLYWLDHSVHTLMTQHQDQFRFNVLSKDTLKPWIVRNRTANSMTHFTPWATTATSFKSAKIHLISSILTSWLWVWLRIYTVVIIHTLQEHYQHFPPQVKVHYSWCEKAPTHPDPTNPRALPSTSDSDQLRGCG